MDIDFKAVIPPPGSRRLGPFWVIAAVLTACFARPIFGLAQLALRDDYYSHLLLVPFITGYLIWMKRKDLAEESGRQKAEERKPRVSWQAVFTLTLGFLALLAYWILSARNPLLPQNDALALATFSYVCFFISGCLWFYGPETVRRIGFPLGFLLVMVPLPTMITHWSAVILQYASADAAHALIKLSGTPVFRHGLAFQVPGIVIVVGEECSGIRSTLVLFITSMLAGYLFLRPTWKRLVLTFFVIPLAILRNGFRIFTIAMLCVHVSPTMIDSPIHHRGGPIFFVLSLIPFFGLLLWLRKEKRGRVNG